MRVLRVGGGDLELGHWRIISLDFQGLVPSFAARFATHVGLEERLRRWLAPRDRRRIGALVGRQTNQQPTSNYRL